MLGQPVLRTIFRELLDTTATNPVVTDTPRNRAVSVTTGLSRGVSVTPRNRAVFDGNTTQLRGV